MANILDLMKYASRDAVAKQDYNDDGRPYSDIQRGIKADSNMADETGDPRQDMGGYDWYQYQLDNLPQPYHDPEHDELVEVPGVAKYRDSKKGLKTLQKSIKKEKLPYATDELPDRGTDAYEEMYDQVMRKQRGNKEKL